MPGADCFFFPKARIKPCRGSPSTTSQQGRMLPVIDRLSCVKLPLRSIDTGVFAKHSQDGVAVLSCGAGKDRCEAIQVT